MTKEELKALGLTDDQVDKVIADYGKNYVAKSQFNSKLEELKHAKAEMEARNKELEDLKKNNTDNAELSKQLETMKQAAKTREKEYQDQLAHMKLDFAVSTALSGAKAKNAKAVKALLNMENVKLGDDGKLVGLTEQLDALKKSDGYLFDDKTNPASGIHPGNSGDPPTPDDTIASQFAKALNGL
jgi:hypothetical protein